MVPVFKNIGERSAAKNYHPVSLLSVVSKVFEKVVNNRIVYHLEKCRASPSVGDWGDPPTTRKSGLSPLPLLL